MYKVFQKPMKIFNHNIKFEICDEKNVLLDFAMSISFVEHTTPTIRFEQLVFDWGAGRREISVTEREHDSYSVRKKENEASGWKL